MFENVWIIGLAVLIGLGITTQASFNTILSRHIGSLEMGLAIHLVGVALLLLAAGVILASRQ
jgi:uncharacterized membrane protein YdcZ (DUF606 family)